MNASNTDLLARAKRDHQARTERIVQSGAHHMASAQHYSDETYLACLTDSLAELASIWREEATAASDANKRGATGTAKSLRDAASRLMGVVEGIKNHGLNEEKGPEHEEPAAAPITAEQSMEFEGITFTKVSDDPFGQPFPPALSAAIHEPPYTHTAALDPVAAEPGSMQFFDIPPVHITSQDSVYMDFSQDDTSVTVTVLPDNPFSGADPKTWEERNLPDVPVFHLEDDPAAWNPSPGHTSYGQGEMAAGCGMKWWLKYRRGAPERPSWALIGGSAFHTFVEMIEHGRFGDPDQVMNGEIAHFTPDYVRSQFHLYLEAEVEKITMGGSPYPIESWHASKQGKEGRMWWETEGPEMVHRYLEWRRTWRAQGWNIAYTPQGDKVIELEFFNRGVKGFIDSAWVRKIDGVHELAIVDWKSGASMPGDYAQPTSYAIALLDLGMLTNVTNVLGAFWDARKGALGPLVDLKVRHTVSEVLMRLEAPKRMDAAGLYMPNVNGGYGGCGSCSFRRSCPVGSRQGTGELAAQ